MRNVETIPSAGTLPTGAPVRVDVRLLSTRELVVELGRKANLLVRKEIELARSEVKQDLRREATAAGGLGVAGVCALVTLSMLLVALAFAFVEGGVLAGWLISLIIAAVVLAIGTGAGLFGWARRLRTPMQVTRRTLREDLRWAKERIA